MPLIGQFYVAATSVIALVALWLAVSSFGIWPGVIPAMVVFPGKPIVRFMVVLSSDLVLNSLKLNDENAKGFIDIIYCFVTPATALFLMLLAIGLKFVLGVPGALLDIAASALAALGFVEHIVRRNIVPPEKLTVLIATWIAIYIPWVLAN